MAKRSDMGKPVTKQELQDSLANVATKDYVKDALANYPTKQDLKDALANYPTKQDLEDALANYPTKDDFRLGMEAWAHALLDEMDKRMDKRIETQFEKFSARLSVELANHVKAANEETRQYIKAIDDKYADLPERVARLENNANR